MEGVIEIAGMVARCPTMWSRVREVGPRRGDYAGPEGTRVAQPRQIGHVLQRKGIGVRDAQSPRDHLQPGGPRALPHEVHVLPLGSSARLAGPAIDAAHGLASLPTSVPWFTLG